MSFRGTITYSSLQRVSLANAVTNRIAKTFSLSLFRAVTDLIGLWPGTKQPSLNGQSGSRTYAIQLARVHPALFLSLTHQALNFSFQAPEKFHDLMAMPQHAQLYRGLVLDIGESLAIRELVEVTYRAARMYIKITPKGVAYIKRQEKELQPYSTNSYSVA